MTKLFDDEPTFLYSVSTIDLKNPGPIIDKINMDRYQWCTTAFGTPGELWWGKREEPSIWARENIGLHTVYSFKYEKDLMLFLLTWG